MLRVSSAVAAVLVCVVASSASAQVIYQPVQVQYGSAMKYYYGGGDPAQHAYADRVACRNGFPSATTGNYYSSLSCTLGQIGENRLILSDCLPLRNAAVYGYREHDAVNEANSNAARYYRKSDQLAAAIPAGDGTLVVSAYAPRAEHAMQAADEMKATKASPGEIKPRAIIILPKRAPGNGDTKPVKHVASAD